MTYDMVSTGIQVFQLRLTRVADDNDDMVAGFSGFSTLATTAVSQRRQIHALSIV